MSFTTNMADTVDKILGFSGAVSSLLAYTFYRLYKSRTETASRVRNIKIWQADLDLFDHLSAVDEHCLAYAAVEGTVKEMGRTLHSLHGQEEGVMMKSQLIEHRSKKVNGFWSDTKKELRDTTQFVPFSLVKPQGGDPAFRLEVVEPGRASHLETELDITYDRFEPHKSTLIQAGLDRLLGEVTKGIQETEKMLLSGTTLLGVGRIFLERGEMKLGPPDDSSQTFILTKMRLSELVRSYESQSGTFKVMAVVSALCGGSVLAYLIWRHLRLWLERRRRRREFEEIRRTVRRDNSAEGRREVGSGVHDEDTCVVCLTNPREVILLNCGHIALCADCAEALPFPKKCPVCRSAVERFMPVFHP